MEWLKTMRSGLMVALLAFAAVLAAASASRHKAKARKWQERAVRDAEGDVEDGVEKTQQALTQAKLHDALARDKEKQTREKLDAIDKSAPTMGEITSRWRKPDPDSGQ